MATLDDTGRWHTEHLTAFKCFMTFGGYHVYRKSKPYPSFENIEFFNNKSIVDGREFDTVGEALDYIESREYPK